MNKFSNLYKKAVVASMLVGSSLLSFAEETGGSSSSIDVSTATDLIGDTEGAMTDILTEAGTSVSAIVAAGLAIWGAIAIIGVLKRAFSAGKGR